MVEAKIQIIECVPSRFAVEQLTGDFVQGRSARLRFRPSGSFAKNEEFQVREVAGSYVLDYSSKECRKIWTVQQKAHPQRWMSSRRACWVGCGPGAFAALDSVPAAGDSSLADGSNMSVYARTWEVPANERGVPLKLMMVNWTIGPSATDVEITKLTVCPASS